MAGSPKNLVGAQVQRLRLASGISQERLAADCQRIGWDLARTSLAKIELGSRRVNDAEVKLLAKVLKVSVGELLEGGSTSEALAIARHGHAD
ncbi:helix-turn-helix transcriptional regulator [Luteolibacter sp. LG18]|uniref:helix-turn-helix domain-containing protein n=1 Tax=Luteolibacter sp. LG18 TaxID=2819286 RepID=UPI002B32324F|nr:hypothetical protein llg_15820 [Luteolibacter sp. LG18]